MHLGRWQKSADVHADKESMSAVADWEWFYVAETSDGRDGVNDGESAASPLCYLHQSLFQIP